ncbi:MAG: Hpt domain-containing protein [Bacillota bacterium]|nr:Hpt domain-containing protein [Bacillota bacterium]
MTDFRRAFERYGANYEDTMMRFMDNEDMYLKLMDMFFQDENMKMLGDALDAHDLSAAFDAAHTLKGVVGNMGLKPMYEAVSAIVEPLRIREDRDDYLQLYGAIQEEFQKAELFYQELKGGV